MLVKLPPRSTIPLLLIICLTGFLSFPAQAKYEKKQSKTDKIQADLSSDDVEVRRDAIISLIQLGDLKYTNIFVTKLRDEDSMVRAYAAEGLGLIGAKAAIGDLRALIKKDSYPLVKAYCAKALGMLGDDAGAPTALLMLEHSPSEAVRRVLAKALGTLSRPDYTAALHKLAKKDPSSKVRINAIKSLGSIGGKKELDLLRFVEKYDFSNDVQKVATNTIRKMEEQLELDLPSNRRALDKMRIKTEIDIKELEEELTKKRKIIQRINEKIQRLEAVY